VRKVKSSDRISIFTPVDFENELLDLFIIREKVRRMLSLTLDLSLILKFNNTL